MNKKGFTLTELLATIAIIGVVSLIGTVSITSIKAKIDENMFDIKLQLALGAATNWGQDNKNLLTSNCTINGTSYKCIDKKISDLISSKYLTGDNESTSFKTNEGKEANSAKIRIYLKNNRVYSCISTKSNIPDSLNNKYKCVS